MTTAPDDVLDRRGATLSTPCPHCKAQPGTFCRTPNGWRTVHQARVRAAQGKQPKPAKKTRRYRLSDAQAQRIEWAAETGSYIAPGQYALLRGDAAERAVADALERHGLIRKTGTTDDGERVFELTADGWAAYHNDTRVIRRVPDDRHPAVCPCRKFPTSQT